MVRPVWTSVTVYANAQEAQEGTRAHVLLERFSREHRPGHARIQRRRWRAPSLPPGVVDEVLRRPHLALTTIALKDLCTFLRLWRSVAVGALDNVRLVVRVGEMADARVWLAPSLLKVFAEAADYLRIEFYFWSCEPRLHTIAMVQEGAGKRWVHELGRGELSPTAVTPLRACQPCTLIVGTRYQSGNAVVLPSSTLAALAAKQIPLCVRPDPEVVRESRVISDAVLLELERGGKREVP